MKLPHRQHNTTAGLRRPVLLQAACLLLMLSGCENTGNMPRYDPDPHAELNIIETFETAQRRRQAAEAEVPAPAETEPLTQEETPNVVRTSHFDFADNRVYQFLRASLQAKLNDHVPFTKWVPAAFVNNVVTYQTYGLNEEQNDVFDQIMAEFAARTRLPLVRDDSGTQTNLYFAYVRFLIEAQQLVAISGKLDEQIERETKRLLEYPLEPELPVRRWDHIRDDTGANVLGNYTLARPVSADVVGNALAGYFVKDIYQALTETVILKRPDADMIGTPVAGPVYSWKLPMINYLLLNAMYEPNVRSGITKNEAVSLILQNFIDEINRARIVTLTSTYTPE